MISAFTLIKFTDMNVVSASAFNLIVKKAKESKENKSVEPAEKKQESQIYCDG